MSGSVFRPSTMSLRSGNKAGSRPAHAGSSVCVGTASTSAAEPDAYGLSPTVLQTTENVGASDRRAFLRSGPMP